MKLVPVSKDAFYAKTKNMELIQEFLNMGADAVRLEGWGWKSAAVGTSTLNATIKRMGIQNLKAISLNKNIFLYRENLK